MHPSSPSPTADGAGALRSVLPAFRAAVRPIQAFFRLEAASGILLLASAVAALAWVNLGGAASYQAVFAYPLALGLGDAVVRVSIHDLVNDGLMTIFFLVVGMEIKRELVLGELRTPAQAALPAIAAAGGMLLPAAIFLAFNWGGPARAGWGIPMATDIAFCVGVLTLLRSRVPHALIVFVTALAIFDDIGGILVIALFYGHGLHATPLVAAGLITVGLVVVGLAKVRSGLAYAVLGALLWYALHGGGVHATIAGVVVGLAIPARARGPSRDTLASLTDHAAVLMQTPPDEELDAETVLAIVERLEELEAPLNRFVHRLHPWVAFAIMPLFALANSGVDLRGASGARLAGSVAIGTAVALFGGKLIGIFAFTAAAVKMKIAPIPGGATFAKLLGVSIVAGIGFTVALFIAGLAYAGHPELLDQAKAGILVGSLAAGIAGALVLRLTATIGEPRADARMAQRRTVPSTSGPTGDGR